MSNRFKKKRKAMWLKNPHCENCGCLTILPEDVGGYTDTKGILKIKVQPINMATIQHKYPRMSNLRTINTFPEKRHFLWCWKCNNEDNDFEQNKIDLKILQQRSLRK